MTSPVEVIARTLHVEAGYPEPSDVIPLAPDYVKLAQAILFDLGKEGIRLIEESDVLQTVINRESGTVSLKLRLEE